MYETGGIIVGIVSRMCLRMRQDQGKWRKVPLIGVIIFPEGLGCEHVIMGHCDGA